MIINVNTSSKKYDVIIEKNILEKVNNYLDLNRKVLIVTDDGIPSCYVNTVKSQCLKPFVYIVKQGESSKSFENYQNILSFMIENNFTRSDAVIAIGGGVVGDLSGFVSSTYMRGIDFYNIPTTLLSQVDSSIGGKTAIDLNGIKNVVGSFYQPSCVIIDPTTLKTLDIRQLHSGLVEAIKMAATCNNDLFNLIKKSKNLFDDIEKIIYESLLIKKYIVENDEKESGLRRVLNFGHTIGHAIESYYNMELLHGECVGLGMLFMSNENVKNNIKEILEKYNLPTSCKVDKKAFISLITHDKKASGNKISIIYVEEIGSYKEVKIDISDLENYL